MPYVAIAGTAYDPDSPITADLMGSLVGNEDWLKSLLESHQHSGADGTAAIEIGPNYVRNASFENGTTGYTVTAYTGGTVTTNTANDLDGATCLAITSTVLANGGGEVITTGYTAVAGGRPVIAGAALKSSGAGISAKVEVVWYDDAQAQISASTIYSTTGQRTAKQDVANLVVAPATARYYRLRAIGGVPASGSATGTIYFDGLFALAFNAVATPGATEANPETYLGNRTGTLADDGVYDTKTTSTSYVEMGNWVFPIGGVYTFAFGLASPSGSGSTSAYGRIYINGVAAGAERSTTNTTGWADFTENLDIAPGDTVQFFLRTTNAIDHAAANNMRFMVANPDLVAGSMKSISIGRRF